MSDSVLPWISGYLVQAAEEYGADLTKIPHFERKKKVQLVEFLTFNEDDILWARASDKSYAFPIRFSREAVQEYSKFSGTRLTKHKTAIVSISKFKPLFTRVPQGRDRLSESSLLALECRSFSVLGSLGEAKFGNPQPLESNKDLYEWSEGLKQDGGAGNCLRDRKRAQQESTSMPLNIVPDSKTSFTPAAGPSKQLVKTTTTCDPPVVKAPNNNTYIFRRVWPIMKDPIFRRPPDDVVAILATMRVDGDPEILYPPAQDASLGTGIAESPRKKRRINPLISSSPAPSHGEIKSRSATPLPTAEWPASDIPSSPIQPSSPMGRPKLGVPSSHPRTPTPAQRAPRQEASPLPRSSPPSQTQSSPPPTNHENFKPPPSLPVPFNATGASETILIYPSTISPPSHSRRREPLRKVPRPREPIKSNRPLAEPIILAPNSDTSHSYSQSQSQSKSNELSQPVILSQLSALGARKRPQTIANPKQLGQSENGEYADPISTKGSISRNKSHVKSRASTSRMTATNVLISSSPEQSLTDDDDDDNADPFAPKIPSSPDIVEKEEAMLAVEPVLTDSDGDIGLQDPADPGPGGHNEPGDVFNDSQALADMNMELDDDDAQIHYELFGPSIPSALLASPNEAGAKKAVSSRPETEQTFAPSNIPTPTTDPASHAADVVHHDPTAWVAPSFQRLAANRTKGKAVSITHKPGTTSHAGSLDALQRSRVQNTQLPLQPQPPKQLLPSRLKRSRDLLSFTEDIPGPRTSTKKRCVQSAENTSGGSLSSLNSSNKARQRSSQARPKEPKRTVRKEYPKFNMDSMRLADPEVKQPLVTWKMLHDILVDLERYR